MTTIRKYIEDNDLTMYKIGKDNGITPSSLSTAFDKNLDKLSFRYLKAIAKSVNKPVGQVATELYNLEKEENEMKNEIIAKINDIQARNGEFNQIESIGSMKDVNKLKSEIAKDMAGEECGFDVDELNSFGSGSTSIIIIATDEYEDGKAIYKAIDMSQDGSARVAREFFNSNTYSDLDSLENLLEN